MDNNNTFEILNAINVNGMTEKKKQTSGTTLTYISWASAYQIAKQHFPDLSYEVERNPETGLPYWYDPLTGYMVFTKVTINGVTHEMWLPVLDATNHAMKSEPYQVKTKYKTLTIQKASMADINRSIMRCLTKCLGMHGLGLYLYQREDLPSVEQAQPAQQPVKPIEKATVATQAPAQKPVRDTRPVTVNEIKTIRQQVLNKYGIDEEWICRKYKAHNLQDLKMYQYQHILNNTEKLKSIFAAEKKAEKQQQLIDIVAQSKQAQAAAKTELTFNDAICPSQPKKEEDGEPIDLKSLGLTEKDIQALTDLGKVFN